MLHYQESDCYRVNPWDTPDPDAIEDMLESLLFYTGTIGDVIWHHLAFSTVTPNEILEHREMQKAALARFLRQSLPPWEDVEVTVISAWYDRLKILLENESPTRSVTED